MRYSLLAGGKRIRPVLCLAAARSLGEDPESVLPAAASIELIHTYSLIHDDLPAMDDDDLRRGRPTSHVAYGEDVAILAGDGLFAEAIRLFCRAPGGGAGPCARGADRTLPRDRRPGDGRRPVRGRTVDPADPGGAAGPPADSTASFYVSFTALKTGRLIGASVLVPLILAGRSAAETAPYREFADELGVLFQIVDDILDVTGSDEQLGKPQGSDERHGKLTYVSLFGLERARELAAESHANARRRSPIDGDTADLDLLVDFIHTRDA